jgi:hypothetical protein
MKVGRWDSMITGLTYKHLVFWEIAKMLHGGLYWDRRSKRDKGRLGGTIWFIYLRAGEHQRRRRKMIMG